jgi:ferrochelatase
MSKGVLLVNLGSPDSPSVSDVRRYLREFLMDGRVLDVNWLTRFCVVNFAILPSRPRQSAEAYHKIWTPAGSPPLAKESGRTAVDPAFSALCHVEF